MARNFNTPVRRTRRVGSKVAVGTGAVFLILFIIALKLVIFGLAVWAVTFGIIDINHVGPNFWNIFWIVLGGLSILGDLKSVGK